MQKFLLLTMVLLCTGCGSYTYMNPNAYTSSKVLYSIIDGTYGTKYIVKGFETRFAGKEILYSIIDGTSGTKYIVKGFETRFAGKEILYSIIDGTSGTKYIVKGFETRI